jgi:hypothetical protein
MSGFVSLWPTLESADAGKSCTDKTDKTSSVSFVGAPERDFGRSDDSRAGGLRAEVEFAPLDRAVISSTAARHKLAEIDARLARGQARAATSDASLVWRQAVDAWGRILAAKQTPVRLAPRNDQPDGDQTDPTTNEVTA